MKRAAFPVGPPDWLIDSSSFRAGVRVQDGAPRPHFPDLVFHRVSWVPDPVLSGR